MIAILASDSSTGTPMKTYSTLLIGIMTMLLTTLANAQTPVRYDLSFFNAVHHEARITLTLSDVRANVLELRMSRSSPGRYALHEFAKNVYDVKAVDRDGTPLTLTRPSPYQWNISSPPNYVQVSYTLFADRADGTYSQIDLNHAHLNMPATLMWARTFEEHPVEITFHDLFSDWKIATQLATTDEPQVFSAPDMQYLMDSPTEISNFSLRQFQIESNGKTYAIRLAVHHDATEDDVDELADYAEAIVNEQMAVYGELPDYDYGTYTFIADYLPYINGDGMEHRNSTILADTDSLAGNARGLTSTLSHELFHSWNVERIRPETLQPFDFERANMSRELWLAEGFTQYYGNLLLRRSGARNDSEFRQTMENLVNTITFSPGREHFNPIEMSMQAPFVDAATALDPTNFINTFFSYYTYGAALAMALDLSLRSEFGLGLDIFMRELWQRHGKTEEPYAVPDLEAALASVSGSPDFARDFFQRFIYGREAPDYSALLANAGLALQPENPEKASLGRVTLSFDDGKATLASATISGTPLYLAGLDRGDQITKIGPYRIRNERSWNRMLGRIRSGETYSIDYVQRGITRHSEITAVTNPTLRITDIEAKDAEQASAFETFRRAWLESNIEQ
jgi:predicted metalloprotease with PDZ domain